MMRSGLRIFCLAALVLAVSGCGGAAAQTPTATEGPTDTATAFELPPENTATPADVPVAVPTDTVAPTGETPVIPNETSAAATAVPATEEPEAPVATATFAGLRPTTAGGKSSGPVCNDARYVADVTVPDGSIMKPGGDFKKTWKLLNYGVCIWSKDFRIAFAYGNPLNGSSAKIGVAVDPGQTVEVTVVLTAPKDNGWYGSWWRMQTDTGVNFGDFVYASIQVTEGRPVTPTP